MNSEFRIENNINNFYQYVPPRSLEEIDTELDAVKDIMSLIQEVHS